VDAEGALDLEQAARLLGDAALVPLVVQAFAASAPAVLERMREDIVSNDAPAVRRHLHRLTPTLALLARRDLQDECARISEAWRAPDEAQRQVRSLTLVDRIAALVRDAARAS